jgi:hypothetical protein
VTLAIISAEKLIYTAWHQVFDRDGLLGLRDDLALQFDVRISIANNGYELDGNTHHSDWEREFFRLLTVVVTGRHQVFVRSRTVLTGSDGQDQPPLDTSWENTSNHDSCWYTDGLRPIWDSMSEGWKHCWDHVPRPHQRSMGSMHHYCTINDRRDSGLIQLVRVEVETDPDCPSNYRKLLKSVAPVQFRIQVE